VQASQYDNPNFFAGVEAGGTKFVCAVGSGPDDIRALARFDTRSPEETLPQVLGFFREEGRKRTLTALGVASFGPVDLDHRSPTFGFITTTPKQGWAGTDILGTLRTGLDLPVAFDTDTNGAVLAEQCWGAAQGLDDVLYLTVGTGIGGGAMVNGSLVHGLVHPEMGHLRIPHNLGDDPFAGSCPFHGDCLEGLASGAAMEQRWGRRPESLGARHPGWELEGHYLALGIANYICVLSPRRIVLGGGVMRKKRLLPLIRRNLQGFLGGYLATPALGENIERYITAPQLGEQAGVLGALALARSLVET
jgi:fructokinase